MTKKIERKSMQAMHGRLSEPGQYQALQHFITHSPWDAQRVWTQRRVVVPVRTGILALDDTGFPKKGTHSVGVQRQYCGALGKIGKCQVAVSSALIADGRTWPLAFDLYLPVSWTGDADRRAAAGLPPTVPFREKWKATTAMRRPRRAARRWTQACNAIAPPRPLRQMCQLAWTNRARGRPGPAFVIAPRW
jgi:SRSO17 transposase